MRATTISLFVALAASACKATSPSAPASVPDATEPPALGDAREGAVRARMQGHERLGDAMRDAVARGDLEEAKGEARLLAALRVEGPPGPTWRQLFDWMTAAAAAVANANDLNDAGRGVGTVAKTCGECHTRFGRPGVIVGQANARASGVRAFMQRHQWAAERLWDGLVVPSDEAWRSGALALSEAPLAPGQLTPGNSPVPKIGDMEQTVHELARQALNAERPEVRANLYGQVLATCAACHTWLGGGPASDGSR